MIKELVARWEQNKPQIRKSFEVKHPKDYKDLVKTVVENITSKEYGELSLDPERIHQIDDGDYQGTLVFVIAEKGYQPSKYYSVLVDYGSCSACDSLQSIRDYSDGPPTKNQVDEYMTLALHIVQKLKFIGE